MVSSHLFAIKIILCPEYQIIAAVDSLIKSFIFLIKLKLK